jgi:hypothetical protein
MLCCARPSAGQTPGPKNVPKPAGKANTGLLAELVQREQGSNSRLNFSGSADLRYLDGGSDVTPSNLNNQGTAGGVSSFAAIRLHLFLDAILSARTTLFAKASGGSVGGNAFGLDALALTTALGHGLPALVAGRYLNNFGKFPQRFLPQDNPLIGDPLLYSYRVALSATQVPASPADLIRQRGRGLGSNFVGYPTTQPGMPVVSNFWYVNGAKLDGVVGRFSYSVGVHNEAISTENFLDPNDNKTVTTHIGYRPDISLNLGASYSQGAYLEQGIFANSQTLGLRIGDYQQRTTGFDVDYAVGHFIFFGEYIYNSWNSPFIAEGLVSNGFLLEPRYRLFPGFTIVARYEQLRYNRIDTPAGSLPWEFPVNRTEVGASYAIERDLTAKVSYTWNHAFTGGRGDPDDDLLQIQLVGVF